MKETDALDDYILRHIDEEGEYLKALSSGTNVENVCTDDSSETGA